MKKIGILQALFAAALFGVSVPLAQALLHSASPVLLAGLLYLGSGLGLMLWRTAMRALKRVPTEASLTRRDWPWLAGAVGFGGIAGPVLLMFGLMQTPAADASLLLNFEGVFTAVIAWFVFKENVDRRVALGFFAIVCGGLLLSWQGATQSGAFVGPVAIVLACFAWGVDNNLTRRIAGADPVQIAGIKGLVAGAVNVALALSLGHGMPATGGVWAMLSVGFLGYGISLVLFVFALRHLGSARTGAYFGTAPFFGAAVALLFFGGEANLIFWIATASMALGVWLHVAERHMHRHTHTPLDHTHAHTHDAHHQHTHDFLWDGAEPHVHAHRHEPLTHTHAHYPDLHHRHRHG